MPHPYPASLVMVVCWFMISHGVKCGIGEQQDDFFAECLADDLFSSWSMRYSDNPIYSMDRFDPQSQHHLSTDGHELLIGPPSNSLRGPDSHLISDHSFFDNSIPNSQLEHQHFTSDSDPETMSNYGGTGIDNRGTDRAVDFSSISFSPNKKGAVVNRELESQHLEHLQPSSIHDDIPIFATNDINPAGKCFSNQPKQEIAVRSLLTNAICWLSCVTNQIATFYVVHSKGLNSESVKDSAPLNTENQKSKHNFGFDSGVVENVFQAARRQETLSHRTQNELNSLEQHIQSNLHYQEPDASYPPKRQKNENVRLKKVERKQSNPSHYMGRSTDWAMVNDKTPSSSGKSKRPTKISNNQSKSPNFTIFDVLLIPQDQNPMSDPISSQSVVLDKSPHLFYANKYTIAGSSTDTLNQQSIDKTSTISGASPLMQDTNTEGRDRISKLSVKDAIYQRNEEQKSVQGISPFRRRQNTLSDFLVHTSSKGMELIEQNSDIFKSFFSCMDTLNKKMANILNWGFTNFKGHISLAAWKAQYLVFPTFVYQIVWLHQLFKEFDENGSFWNGAQALISACKFWESEVQDWFVEYQKSQKKLIYNWKSKEDKKRVKHEIHSDILYQLEFRASDACVTTISWQLLIDWIQTIDYGWYKDLKTTAGFHVKSNEMLHQIYSRYVMTDAHCKGVNYQAELAFRQKYGFPYKPDYNRARWVANDRKCRLAVDKSQS